MDMEILMRWLGAVAMVLSIVNLSWLLISRGGQEVLSKLKQYGGDLASHDRRIQAVEAELKHVPSKDDFTELRLSVATLEGQLGRMDESLGSVARTVRRIDDYLRAEKV